MRYRFGLGIALATVLAGFGYAQPFTFQGMLKQNGNPANGTLSMTFKLYDAPTGGNQIGSPITQNVSVQNGLFTVELDFGNVWNGTERYLEIQVGSTVLSPRVRINPVPYAIFAQRPWQTSGSTLFYTDGNVGIGTNNPASRLSLGGGNANTKLALWQGGSATDVMGFGVGPGQFRFHLHHLGNRFSFLNAPNGNEVFTILGNGNVGIGTTSPSQRLQVEGNSVFMGHLGVGTTNPNQRLHVEGVSYFNGNVGIGTSSPAARLSLGSASNTTKLAFYALSSGPVGFAVRRNQFRMFLNGRLYYNFAFLDSPGGNHLMKITGHGVITIGTVPHTASEFEVGGNGFYQGNLEVARDKSRLFIADDGRSSSWRVQLYVEQPDGPPELCGRVAVRGANASGFYGWNNVLFASVRGTYSKTGIITVHDSEGTEQAGFHVDWERRGYYWGDVKSFRVPDPEDPTRDIWYACIEGPEAAMYVRGTARLVNGRARIELPDHFRKLADEQGMTVQLTPLSIESKGLCVVRKGLDGIEVMELRNGRGNYEFDWRVEAVRKEHRDFRVYRPWDEVMSGGIDPAEAWEARLRSIQARQERQQSFSVKP